MALPPRRIWLATALLAITPLAAVQPAAQAADPLGGTVTGVVLREDGTVLPPGTVVLLRSNGTNIEVAPLDSDGAYTMTGVTAGSYDLTAVGPSISSGYRDEHKPDAQWYYGGAPTAETATRVGVGMLSTTRADLRIPRNGTVSGRVLDSNGRPVAGVEAYNSTTDDVAVTDAEGRWSLGGYAAGTYKLTIRDPQFRVQEAYRTVDVALRQPTQLDLTLPFRGAYWLEWPSFEYTTIPAGETVRLRLGRFAQPDVQVVSVKWRVDSRPVANTGLTLKTAKSNTTSEVDATITVQRKGIRSVIKPEDDFGYVIVRPPAWYRGTMRAALGVDRGEPYGPIRDIAPNGESPMVGDFLYLNPPQTHPVSTITGFVWLRDGVAIDGATEPIYQATSEDLGHRITGRTLFRRTDGSATSRSLTSSAVIARRPDVAFSVSVRGSRRVDITPKLGIRGLPTSWVDGRLDVYRTRSGDDRLTTVTVRDGKAATIILRNQPTGRQTYWVRFRPDRPVIATTSAPKRAVQVR